MKLFFFEGGCMYSSPVLGWVEDTMGPVLDGAVDGVCPEAIWRLNLRSALQGFGWPRWLGDFHTCLGVKALRWFPGDPRFRSAACCGSHLKQSSERGWFLGMGVVMGKCHDKTCIMSFFILPWVLWIGMGTEWKLLHPSSLSIGMLTNGSEVLITTGRTLTTLWQSNMAMENPSFFCGMWAFPLL